MSSCMELGYRSSAMLGSRSSRLLLLPAALRGSVRFRCVLDQLPPSLGTAITSGNAIVAAAAAASGSGTAHAAVTSALAHVAVTAVAIASGACLSTKVDFLWPRVEEQPGPLSFPFLPFYAWNQDNVSFAIYQSTCRANLRFQIIEICTELGDSLIIYIVPEGSSMK